MPRRVADQTDAMVDREALAQLFAAADSGDVPASGGSTAGGVRSSSGGSGSGHGQGHHRHHRRRKNRKRRALIWSLSILGVLIVIIGVGAVLGVTFVKQATSARDDLMAAKTQIAAVPALLEKGDVARLDQAAAQIKTHTDAAYKTVQGPLWDIAAKVPWVGKNVAAVQNTTVAAHILVDDALPQGIKVITGLQAKNLKLKGGGINLKPFEAANKALPGIADAFHRASAKVSGIELDGLLSPIRDAIGGMVSVIDENTPTVENAQRVLPVVLPMLGSDGARHYLLVFQNNAEIRATGGNPASSAEVKVDHGKVTLVDQASSETFYQAGTVRHTYTKLPKNMLKIYPQDTPWYSQNYSRTPNFPTTAKMFRDLWKATTDRPLDGVISVDPVVLSHLLKVTGPVSVDGDRLTAANVVKTVLSDAYARFPRGPDSDAYFAKVASAVFTKIAAGDWDPTAMIDAFVQSAKEQRVYLWFPKKTEQALAVQWNVDGQLPQNNTAGTQVGIFLNDYAVGKQEYWLSTKIDLTCNVSKRTVTTKISMKNRMPSSDFVDYVLGLRSPRFGRARTTMLLDVLYFAPPGAKAAPAKAAASSLIPSLARSGQEDGRNVTSVTVAVPKGQTETVSYTTALPERATAPLSVRYSPTATTTPVSIAENCAQLVH